MTHALSPGKSVETERIRAIGGWRGTVIVLVLAAFDPISPRVDAQSAGPAAGGAQAAPPVPAGTRLGGQGNNRLGGLGYLSVTIPLGGRDTTTAPAVPTAPDRKTPLQAIAEAIDAQSDPFQ